MMKNLLVETILNAERELLARVRQCGNCCFSEINDDLYLSVRASQIEVWNEAVLKSYAEDVARSQQEGRNILCDMYAYALEYGSRPKISPHVGNAPEQSTEKRWLIDWICGAHKTWQEALTDEDPELADWLHTVYEELAGSFFLEPVALFCGQFAVCSVETLRCYGAFAEKTQKNSGNLNRLTAQNLAVRRGRKS